MRFLFTTLEGAGHFHPLVPPARALQSAGHEVVFAAAPSLHASIEGSGFPAQAAGFDRRRDGADEAFVRLQADLEALPRDGPARTMFRIRRLFAGVYAERMVPDLLAIASGWRPDVIVREAGEFGGCVAAEVLGIPHASVRSNTMLSGDAARKLVAPELERLRVAHGLDTDPDGTMVFRYLHLALEPPRFHDPALPLAPTAHLLRPIPFSQSGSERLPAWVARLEHPIVYATLGTVFNTRTPGLFEAILNGLRHESVQLILTIGRDRQPSEFGPLPENARVERYIPQSLLLPNCDLVICHGGFSTVVAARTCGLPMVVIPIDADQPLNAQRCVALGAAKAIPPSERTPDAIRDAARTVLGDPSYRMKAEAVAAETAALPGPEHAVTLLEQLARERRPVPSLAV